MGRRSQFSEAQIIAVAQFAMEIDTLKVALGKKW